MKIGVVFPQTEFGNDPMAIRDYAQTAEALGFTHIIAYDHVLGANPDRPGGWTGPYTHLTPFHEPFVLFSYMAAFTTRIEFAPGVIILPQRQTALVAKQASTLDVLSGGRLRLGVGLGWNAVEYTALNEDFHTRGPRISEQVKVLRELWTKPLVNFTGKYHTIPDAGLNPLPIQRPIPIWFGGSVDAALKRAARVADGWLSTFRVFADAQRGIGIVEQALQEYGRTRSEFGIEGRFNHGGGNADDWRKSLVAWRDVGASHVSFNTMGAGLSSPQAHIDAIRSFAQLIADF
ncbi:MAG: LLM class F420-dependent oxidoreductase [Anaerolineae bacterium]